ncbi:hypothetical protein [Oecophyllibacter saccharovorans]|uniref:hypothetical protein n=1 Tax=Oecophyllibacter saccharovorans TaxID=2558360 RepID=UPI001166BC41|nr:hypothetical protein [Oecophyllibacter saccharovorans]TPW36615.1 hypothetical protein E3203_02295 [Oecophyllibacter saccharovorans]
MSFSELQRSILECLNQRRGYWLTYSDFEGIDLTYDDLCIEVLSLKEYGLIEADIRGKPWGGYILLGVRINNKGSDSLKEDGGLTAQLETVTVRLDPNSFKALIETYIDASNHSLEEKSRLKEGLKKLSAMGLQAVAQKLIDIGLKHAPDLLTLGIF